MGDENKDPQVLRTVPLQECLIRFKVLSEMKEKIEGLDAIVRNGHTTKIAVMSVQMRWIMAGVVFLIIQCSAIIVAITTYMFKKLGA